MYKQYSETGIKSISTDERFFIPMVPVCINHDVLNSILQHTKWIGFNFFDLRKSKYYELAKRIGIKAAFNIGEEKKVFITSTETDEKLAVFYNSQDGIKNYKSDISDFNVDLAMGPDWYAYEDDPPNIRADCVKKAMELNLECIDMENVLPNIHGTNLREVREFIKPFKEHGKKLFVMAGRCRLINLGERKKSQMQFANLTSQVVKQEDIRMIITGCSSPKLQETMPYATAFASYGYLIQARNRRLIMSNTYRRISDHLFSCNDPRCCCSMSKEKLMERGMESVGAVHNIIKISSLLPFRRMIYQLSLEMI